MTWLGYRALTSRGALKVQVFMACARAVSKNGEAMMIQKGSQEPGMCRS